MLGTSKTLVLLHCVSGYVLAVVNQGLSCTGESEAACADSMLQKQRRLPSETEPISETNSSIKPRARAGAVFDLIKTSDPEEATTANCRLAVDLVSSDKVRLEEMMKEIPKETTYYQLEKTNILILEYGNRTEDCCKAKAYIDWSDYATTVSFSEPAPVCRQVTRFDCARNGSMALQVATSDGKASVRYLNITTGEYKPLFDLPHDITNPPFTAINACAINPKDDVIYCSIDIDQKGTFLVRINAGELGYVTKLPGFRYAAAFDSDGNYYMGGGNGFSYIKKTQNLPTLLSWKDFDDAKDTKPKFSKTLAVHMGGDMALLEYDLEVALKYLVSIIGGKLRVVRVFHEPCDTRGKKQHHPLRDQLNKTSDSWLLPTEGLPKDVDFGTAWNFKSGIYFAADTGEGVYKLDERTINIHNRQPVTFTKVGNAAPSEWNDGMSCIDDDGPF